MNICMFSRVNYWHGIRGGMDLHGKLLAEGIVARGHRVTILSSKHPDGTVFSSKNGIDIHYLPNTVFGSRRCGWPEKSVEKFERLHRHNPFDLIWSQSFDAFGFARKRRFAKRPPIVATLHGCVAQEAKSFLSNASVYSKKPSRFAAGFAGLFYAYFLCQKPLLSIADRAICVSPSVAEDIGKWFGRRYKIKCAVVENGIDSDFFRPDPKKGQSVRKRLGVARGEKLLLSLGRLNKEKGHHLAIQALKKIIRRNISAKLILAGEGDYLGPLKEKARRLGLEERVLFPGFVSHDEIVGCYNAADVFLMPSTTIEGLPFVLLEAMSCGVPVVASSVGGNCMVIEHGIDGMLAEPGNIDELAARTMELIDDDPKRRRISKAGRKKVAESFAVGKMTDRVIRIMASVVACGPAANGRRGVS